MDKDIGGRGSRKLLFLLDLRRKVAKTLSLGRILGVLHYFRGNSVPFDGMLVAMDGRGAMNSTGWTLLPTSFFLSHS